MFHVFLMFAIGFNYITYIHHVSQSFSEFFVEYSRAAGPTDFSKMAALQKFRFAASYARWADSNG